VPGPARATRLAPVETQLSHLRGVGGGGGGSRGNSKEGDLAKATAESSNRTGAALSKTTIQKAAPKSEAYSKTSSSAAAREAPATATAAAAGAQSRRRRRRRRSAATRRRRARAPGARHLRRASEACAASPYRGNDATCAGTRTIRTAVALSPSLQSCGRASVAWSGSTARKLFSSTGHGESVPCPALTKSKEPYRYEDAAAVVARRVAIRACTGSVARARRSRCCAETCWKGDRALPAAS